MNIGGENNIIPFIVPDTDRDAPVQEALSELWAALDDPLRAGLSEAILRLRQARIERFPSSDSDPWSISDP